MHLFVRDRNGVFTGERRDTAQHLVHHDAQRVNVGALFAAIVLLAGGIFLYQTLTRSSANASIT
ncbi:MAG: hypothetical protein ACKOEH_01895, partial [Actinomycetota bacterium]